MKYIEYFLSYYKNIEFDRFYIPFLESYYEFQDLKKIDDREYSNSKRFEIMLNKMSLLETNQNNLIENLTEAHMEALSSVMSFPKKNKKILEQLKSKKYKLYILSNFDHAIKAHSLVKHYKIEHYFDDVFISEEIGWRKPSKNIFNFALNKINVIRSKIIFVGDNYHADVCGAKKSDIDVIWLNRNKSNNLSANFKPDFSVSNLENILNIL